MSGGDERWLRELLGSLVWGLPRLIIPILVVSTPAWLSWLVWLFSAPLPISVGLIDYTVPFENYAEHQGIHWLLSHEKVAPQRSLARPGSEPLSPPFLFPSRRPAPWRVADDYIGFDPSRDQHRRLEGVLLPRLDWLYISDTYGVYIDDRKVNGEETPHMDWSRLVFGGLSTEDLDRLEAHVERGGDLFFEFNSFCDPTSSTERGRAEALIGLEWSGWVGRLFLDLYDEDDTPHWLPRLFKEQYPGQTLPRFPTLAFVHRSGRLLLISHADPLQLAPFARFTEVGVRRFGIESMPRYLFWFSIMRPRVGAAPTSYATLDLPQIPGAEEVYQAIGISHQIPLLTSLRFGASVRYYLAVDGSDLPKQPASFRFAGLPLLQRLIERDVSLSRTALFWQLFVPAISQIFHDEYARDQARRAK